MITLIFISDIYRTNMFHLTSTGCALVLQKDLEYWGIDELMMEPCCALKYYPEIETCVNEKQVKKEILTIYQCQISRYADRISCRISIWDLEESRFEKLAVDSATLRIWKVSWVRLHAITDRVNHMNPKYFITLK